MEISKLVEEVGKLQGGKHIVSIKLHFRYLSCFISILEDSDEIGLTKYSDSSALNESDEKLIYINA